MADKSKNYIDKQAFLDEIAAFQTAVREAEGAGKPKPRMPDSIGIKIDELAQRIASRPNFRKYSYIEEMKQDGILDCIQAVMKFDTTRPEKNPFGYFSRCVWWAFLGRIKTEKEEHEFKMNAMFDPMSETWSTLDGDTSEYNVGKTGELLDFYYGSKL